MVESGRKDLIGANPPEIAADKLLDLLARLIARAHLRDERVGGEQHFSHGNGTHARRLPHRGIKRDAATQERKKGARNDEQKTA